MTHTRRTRTRRYGWIPDLPDVRDRLFAARPEALAALPPRMDLRDHCPAVYNQGTLGSCTANAIAAAVQFDRAKQALADVFTPSRLFIYYNERAIEGTVDSDAGAMLRDGIKSVAKLGAPHEALWPYVVRRFRDRPSAAAFKDGARHDAVAYQRLPHVIEQLKGCLASGYPFVFGFTVYESFEAALVARTGAVPMPKRGESVLGGHAVLAVGYDDTTTRFIVRNSWGPDWGQHGYFTMPYAYLLDQDLSDDFWNVQTVQ
ncbi:MAG: C1 family peptidase [Vicinamibacterales bacterium]